ncbi:MAG TPA: ATP-binding protein, partial [Polyangiaceae bacterium]
PSGAGKTSLAVAMMRQHTDAASEAGMFVLATDLHNCKSRSKLGHEPDLIAAAVNAPMLVLDDLGTEPLDRAGAVVEVVFHRHAHDLPTVVTTWLGDDETRENRGAAIANRYGDGFARRVVGDARVIHLGAKP